MTKFIYKAKRNSQSVILGEVQAADREQALSKIMQEGLFPFEIREEKAQEDQPFDVPPPARLLLLQDTAGRSSGDMPRVVLRQVQHPSWKHPEHSRRIALSGPAAAGPSKSRKPKRSFHSFPRLFYNTRRKMLADFTRQLSDLTSSNIDLLKALDLVRGQSSAPFLKSVLDQIHPLIKDGRDLSDALSQHPEIFSGVYVSLIKSGELSGRLPEVLSRTAQLIQKDYETRSQIASSLIYPFFVLGVGLITVMILLVGVIPRLAEMFDEMNQALPWATQLLIGLSRILVRFWWLAGALLAVGIWLWDRWQHSFQGKLRMDDLKIKLPVAGDFFKSIELGRLMRTLATLLESGIVIDQALRSAQEVLDNEILKQEFKGVLQEVINGSSLAQALKRKRHFSESAVGIIAVSEASGRLPEGLSRLADSYERHSNGVSKILISVLEPAMILAVGLFVGFIVMALILPILQMNLLIQ